MYTRRKVLAALATTVPVLGAGCSGPDAGGAGTPARTSETTWSDGGSRTTDPGPTVRSLELGESAEGRAGTTVTVSAVRLRKIVYTVDVGSSVHPYPAGEDGSQFLVADVATAEDGDVSSLPLVVTLDGTDVADGAYRLEPNPGPSGSLAFSVPVSTVEDGAITWRPTAEERYRWALPDSTLADVGRSPEFDVVRFDVPDAIERDEPFEAVVEVDNRGDRDGRFLGVVLDRGASSLPLVPRFAFEVPVGEAVTKELEGREVETGESSATTVLDWGIGRREASFSIAR